MGLIKKFDRAFQWAGEKMGQEARTSSTEEFRMLETEMTLRHEGLDRLHRSMNTYIKAISRRGETFEDKEKGLPVAYLGRTMASHGDDFEPDSEYGNCLIAMGRANERIANLQEQYVADASAHWLEGLERSLTMMKEYQTARKKLESRRLAYDASTAKFQKAKREDFRLEDELRTAKAKYEESSEDVYRRMQDVKEAEVESVQDLTNFLDAELEYHERCTEELRRVRQQWIGGQSQGPSPSQNRGGQSEFGLARRGTTRSRSNTAHSLTDRQDRTERWAQTSRRDIYEDDKQREPEPVRMPIRSARPSITVASTPVSPPRPNFNRASTHAGTFEGPASRSHGSYREPPPPPQENGRRTTAGMPANVGALRNNLRPVSRIQTNSDVFGDDYDTNTSSGSPEYDRSESPATSYGSLSRTASNAGFSGGKKAPPPPPPSRAKKPAPPIPQKREALY